MSMYNMLFGSNPASEVILATLGLKKDDVGRFRDCFIADGKIVVYTRNGGGNRICWRDDEPTHDSDKCGCPGCVITYKLPKHVNYLYDCDDGFDCTYATIYFEFPEEYKDALTKLDSGEKFNPDERWLDMLERIATGKEAQNG